MKTIYAVENHGNDSRVRLHYNGIVQSLTTRMGTGGGNVPMVLITRETTDEGNSLRLRLKEPEHNT